MIEVENIYFQTNELIRASSIGGDYEHFMIMSTESPERYGDFITVEGIYVGDTEHCDDTLLTQNDLDDGAMKHTIPSDFIEKLIDTAKNELKNTVGEDGKGYVYVCRREDDDFTIGICTSTEPLKKATIDKWEKL